MNKKYDNPPIVEALCEFRFIPSQPWDITIPGLLYDKIKDQFPEKKQKIRYDVGFRPKEDKMEHRVDTSQLMQFRRSDNSALVQVGPNLLTINHLKPYSTWKDFKPLILKNLERYRNIVEPKGFNRIGLRYINKIDFDKVPIELTDYFNYYPFIPKGLPQIHDVFTVRVEIPYEDGRDRLLLTLATTVQEEPAVLSLLFDLDYVMVMPEHISFEQASDWIEKAHITIENAFETCITDKCRNLFREKK